MPEPRTLSTAMVDRATDPAVTGQTATSVMVCFPCRNEADTIGPLVSAVRHELMEQQPVVAELVVMDDGSTDDTARVAAEAGAKVFDVESVTMAAGVDPGRGKGNALWASLLATDSDLCVWCDGDLQSFSPDWILRLIAPLLEDPTTTLVKADYLRPEDDGGGGRTTELVARPLLSMFHPELAVLGQPLSGEFAARRSAVEQIPFVQGWGVEVAMLIDLAERFGADTIQQVDLGVRRHRHHRLSALSKQAAEVAATVLVRNDVALTDNHTMPLTLITGQGSRVELNLAERPSIRSLRTWS